MPAYHYLYISETSWIRKGDFICQEYKNMYSSSLWTVPCGTPWGFDDQQLSIFWNLISLYTLYTTSLKRDLSVLWLILSARWCAMCSKRGGSSCGLICHSNTFSNISLKGLLTLVFLKFYVGFDHSYFLKPWHILILV